MQSLLPDPDNHSHCHTHSHSLSSKLSLLWGRLHALLVSEVAQTAQHSRMCIAHECDIAEPFTERVVLEGEVLIVRCLVAC